MDRQKDKNMLTGIESCKKIQTERNIKRWGNEETKTDIETDNERGRHRDRYMERKREK